MTLTVLNDNDVQQLRIFEKELSEHLGMPITLQLDESDDSEFSFDSTRYHLRATNVLLTTDRSNGEEVFGNVSMGPGTWHMVLPCVWQNFRKQLADCDTLNVFNMDSVALTKHHPLPVDLDLGGEDMELPERNEDGGLRFDPPRGYNPENDTGPTF